MVPDIVAEENALFNADVEPSDIVFLQRVLAGSFQMRGRSFVVLHTVGHVVLPSGRVLSIRSRKAPAASILAWSAYVDPLIGDLRILGRMDRAAQEADVAALLAQLFLSELARVVAAQGLARTYCRTRTDSATVRGRIDFVRLARRAGDLSQIPCEIWARRPHTSTMRLLAAALVGIAADPVMRGVDSALLRSLRLLFEDVPPRVEEALLWGRVPLPSNEQPFETAIALARLVLRHLGLGEGAKHDGLSFLVALDLLFERAVVRALQENGIRAIPKHPVRHERVGSSGEATFGLSPMELDAWCPTLAFGGVVVDAKYKEAISSANLQQMLAYCTLTGARQAVLVVPSGLVHDRRPYRFAPAHGDSVTIHVVELEVDGRDIVAWRTAGEKLARRVVSVCNGEIGVKPHDDEAAAWRSPRPR